MSTKYIFERAPEPTDVYWENMRVSHLSRVFRIFLTYISTIFLIGICFAIFWGINYAKKDLKNKYKPNTVRGLSVACSIVVVIINIALRTVVRQLSIKEKHETYTAYNISVAFKLTIARFVNTSIVPIVVNYMVDRWFKEGGLSTDIFYIMISISFLDPILYVVDVGYFLRLCRRRSERNKGQRSLLT